MSMRDRHYATDKDMSSPAAEAEAVTPDDDNDLAGGVTRALYVGTEGDLAVMTARGNVVTFRNAAGGYHPLRVIRVLDTGTTAADIVALY